MYVRIEAYDVLLTLPTPQETGVMCRYVSMYVPKTKIFPGADTNDLLKCPRFHCAIAVMNLLPFTES